MKLKNVLKAIAVLGCAGALAVSFAACGGGEEEKPAGKTHDPVTLEVTGKTGTYEPHNFVDGKCTMCDETTIFTQDTIAKDAIVSTACDQQGTVTKITYETDAYGEDVITKTAYVYTPYGYNAEDTTTKYDVLYLVHGKGLNEGYWFAQGSYKKDDSIYQSGGNGTTNVLDTMMKDGDAKKAIIVTPTFYLPGEDGTTDSSDDSMNRISPPTAVHANPVTTPTWSFPSYLSEKYSSGPKYSFSDSTDIVFANSLSLALRRAMRRSIFAIFFSNCRTPDSRV